MSATRILFVAIAITLMVTCALVLHFRYNTTGRLSITGFRCPSSNNNHQIINTTTIQCAPLITSETSESSLIEDSVTSSESSTLLNAIQESITSPPLYSRFTHPPPTVYGDCEKMISFFPINDLLFYPSFLASHKIDATHEGIKRFLMNRCMNRFKELYRSHGKYTGFEQAKTNLIVLDLESTITMHKTINISSILNHSNHGYNILIQANVDDLVFNSVFNHLIYYRQDLMYFFDLKQNEFDFGIYAEGNDYINKYNAVVIELYYNWIYLSRPVGIEQQLKFKFVHQTTHENSKKSVQKLNDVINVCHYEHVIIIDDESGNIWHPIFKIFVPMDTTESTTPTHIISIIANPMRNKMIGMEMIESQDIYQTLDEETRDGFLMRLTELLDNLQIYNDKIQRLQPGWLTEWISMDMILNKLL